MGKIRKFTVGELIEALQKFDKKMLVKCRNHMGFTTRNFRLVESNARDSSKELLFWDTNESPIPLHKVKF